MKRTVPTLGTLALVTQLCLQPFLLGGCGGANNPSTGGDGSGGATGSVTGSGGATPLGGGTGGGTTTAGSGGKEAIGSGGATPSASGGAPGTGSGGTSTTGSGGTSTTGSGGTPASSGGGASGSGTFSPLCSAVPVTAAGAAPTKAGACTATDSQLCYKTCGPQSIGYKSETCTAGAYAEQSGCSFEMAMDYSCFKIPAAVSAACPAAPPQASQPCTVAACTLCNVAGNYLDSSGASKAGYCVCPAPGTSGTSKWSCASSTAWPCPAGQGC